ncbi:hypothetical protein MMC18_000684 [Xylographa bjoerkii]|nr:hypothetical protein [Xylographa bjoerkii]
MESSSQKVTGGGANSDFAQVRMISHFMPLNDSWAADYHCTICRLSRIWQGDSRLSGPGVETTYAFSHNFTLPIIAIETCLEPGDYRPCHNLLTRLFVDAARGEQTASAMETKLSSLEQRIDDLLASMDDSMDDKSRDEKNGEVENKQGHKD